MELSLKKKWKESGRMGNIMINEQSLKLMEENGQVISEGINLGTSHYSTKKETSI